MSIANYTDLKTAILDWMTRNELTGSVADFITLGEARLNRLLDPVGTTATLAATIGSASVSIASLSIVSPVALFNDNSGAEYEIIQKPLGGFTLEDTEGAPTFWAIEGQNINFDRPCDQAYSLRFVYEGRFALSNIAPTNEFLTNNPDLYMAAAIVWGSVYVQDIPNAAMWKQMLDEFTAEVKHNNAQKKRGTLTVDVGVLNRRSYYIGNQ